MPLDELGHGLLKGLWKFRLETHNTGLSRGLLKAFRHLVFTKRPLVLHIAAPASRTSNMDSFSFISRRDSCLEASPALAATQA
ncbi:hypothetical protein KR52_05300 [Synechococcus sp. KORDI-52]|nr:hypothetical protein KR52_05300 [Synechococcus sp. KORDI-52]